MYLPKRFILLFGFNILLVEEIQSMAVEDWLTKEESIALSLFSVEEKLSESNSSSSLSLYSVPSID